MSLESFYFISQIIAAASIVASLLFVGIQLRQGDRTQASSPCSTAIATGRFSRASRVAR
jgi:hypothetical protein